MGKGKSKLPPQARFAKFTRKLQERKSCLHPRQDQCQGPIIKAHSISKSASLKPIATNGHVLMFDRFSFAEMSTAGQLWPTPHGINRATTFTGFCRHHDQELFEPIDDHDPAPTLRNAGLFAFRTFAREFYAKKGTVEALEEQLAYDRTESPGREIVEDVLSGIRRGFDDLKAQQTTFQNAVLEDGWSDFDFYWVEFDGRPAISVSGGVFPEYDFRGKQLQTLAADEVEPMTVNVLARSDGTSVVFTWPRDADAPRSFVDSFDRLDDGRKGTATVCLSFEHFENTALSAVWWESLRTAQKSALIRRHETAMSPMNERMSDCLEFGARQYVNWSVSSITSSDDLLRRAFS
jgi:hypothetical protein